MIATDNLLLTQITMLILLLMGYILVKLNVMDAAFRKGLTDFVIKFILPCNIIKSFIMEFDMQISCEGGSIIEVEIPEDYHDKKNYVICLETEEKEPIFEALRG